jgi:hypothetical protein
MTDLENRVAELEYQVSVINSTVMPLFEMFKETLELIKKNDGADGFSSKQAAEVALGKTYD